MASPAQSLPPASRLGPQRVMSPNLPEETPGESLPQPAAESSRWPGVIIALAGSMGVLLGLLVIVGWHTGHILSPFAFRFESVPVRYNTGLCFLFSGTALLLLARRRIGPAQLAAAPLALLGLLTCCEYVFSFDLGIDELLFRSGPVSPRMAPNTALCFTLLGSALLLAAEKGVACATPRRLSSPHWSRRWDWRASSATWRISPPPTDGDGLRPWRRPPRG
jgi:hypothetical protein